METGIVAKHAKVSAVVTLETKEEVRQIAIRDRRSEGDIIRLALEDYIDKNRAAA